LTSHEPTAARQGFAVASLVLGVVGLFTLGILVIGALLGFIFGVVAVVKANNEPAKYGGKGKAIVGMALCVLSLTLMPVVIGLVAAIAIPSVLRARVSANETQAIAEVRKVAAAEAVYQAANGGYFDRPWCLANPSQCIPGHSGPPLIEARLSLSQPPRQGYRPWFHPGPAAPSRGAKTSPSSVTSFAYVLVPVAAGQTGVRSFCTDASGRVCFYVAGRVDESSEMKGSCPQDCVDLN
jgi:type IV pilus assembly protein PilA